MTHITLSDPSTFTPELRAHLESCSDCRNGLLLMRALHLPEPPAVLDCAQCRPRLPAFVARERLYGVNSAIFADAEAWWHLWGCAECLVRYDELVVAQAASTSVVNDISHAVRELFRLSRDFLVAAIPAPADLLAPTRGGGDGAMVVADETYEDDSQFLMLIEAQPDHNWTITVTLTPPVAGHLVLTCGEQNLRAPFDPTGSAVMRDVPTAILNGADVPDLVLSVERTPKAQSDAQ